MVDMITMNSKTKYSNKISPVLLAYKLSAMICMFSIKEPCDKIGSDFFLFPSAR